MRALSWLLGAFFLAVLVSLLAHYNNGLVMVVLPPWQAEFSLNFLILALAALFFLVYLLVRSLLFTFSLPARARVWQARRQREQDTRDMEEALRLLFEGRYGHALRRAEVVWKRGHARGTAALIAARAAQRLREAEKVAQWLEQARTGSPETEAAVLMIGAETAVEMGDFQEALRRLRDLQEQRGRHIAALRLELKARQYSGDVQEVLKLARQLEKRGALQAEAARAIRHRAHQDALAQRQEDATQLLAYFNDLRKEERSPQLVLSVARNLRRLGEDEAAAPLVEAALEEGEWTSALADLYGQLEGAGRAGSKALTARIAKAEEWLKRHPADHHLLLALGRLCARQQLWGKARSYMEVSLAILPGRENCLALARLLDHLGETEAANRYFRQAAAIDEA
jgi:HemY protein